VPTLDTSTSVLEAQLDYLTITEHSDAAVRNLRLVASELSGYELAEKQRARPFAINGYVGWRVGRVSYGERQTAGLLQLSGQLAEDWAGSLVGESTHVTRVDTAVTVRYSPSNPLLGDSLYQQALGFYSEHPRSALPWRVEDANGGATVYLGSRKSPTFFRAYFKEAEAREEGDSEQYARYQAAWRYELESHDAAADTLCRSALAAPSRAAHCQGVVWEYMRAHGLDSGWDPVSGPVYVGGFRRRSDYQSRLRWFARSVAPAVRWAIDLGDRAEVLNALGLDDDGSPDGPAHTA
jgi:hypothetical protein